MRITLFVVLLGLVSQGLGDLYGIVTDFEGDETQTVVLTVRVDPTTGNFTKISENFIYIGSSATYDGIAAYDQKNNYLYYSTDFESSFVFGIDVTKAELLPPISIGSEAVTSIDWDGTNQQLLINGFFADQSSAIFTFPYAGPSVELINFTTKGISAAEATYLDWKKGIFYLAYYDGTQYQLGSFPIATPATISSAPLGCGAGLAPEFLFGDSATSALIGIGYNGTAKSYRYFTVVNKVCKVYDVGLTGIITAATYDPTKGLVYLGYVDDVGSSMVTLNAATMKVASKIATVRVLEDLQVTYTL